MKLKRIAVEAEFKWNEILFDAVCEQFHMLGYRWFSERNHGPLKFCDFNNINIYVHNDGYLLQSIPNELFSSSEVLTLDDFFKLAPEDVRVEPERFPCEVYLKGEMGSRHVGNLQEPQRLEYSDNGYCELTQDQIDRIKAIMEES